MCYGTSSLLKDRAVILLVRAAKRLLSTCEYETTSHVLSKMDARKGLWKMPIGQSPTIRPSAWIGLFGEELCKDNGCHLVCDNDIKDQPGGIGLLTL